MLLLHFFADLALLLFSMASNRRSSRAAWCRLGKLREERQMTQINITGLEVAKLTAVITGGGFKRSASKEIAATRFYNAASNRGIAVVDAAIILEAATFEAASAQLQALLAPPAAAKKAAAERKTPVAKDRAATEQKAGSKIGAVMERAKSDHGVSNSEIRSMTGWAKLGGFFNAVTNSGFDRHRVREDGDTRWFVVAPGSGCHAYIRPAAGEPFQRFGTYKDADEASKAAKETAAADGEDVSIEMIADTAMLITATT